MPCHNSGPRRPQPFLLYSLRMFMVCVPPYTPGRRCGTSVTHKRHTLAAPSRGEARRQRPSQGVLQSIPAETDHQRFRAGGSIRHRSCFSISGTRREKIDRASVRQIKGNSGKQNTGTTQAREMTNRSESQRTRNERDPISHYRRCKRKTKKLTRPWSSSVRTETQSSVHRRPPC